MININNMHSDTLEFHVVVHPVETSTSLNILIPPQV